MNLNACQKSIKPFKKKRAELFPKGSRPANLAEAFIKQYFQDEPPDFNIIEILSGMAVDPVKSKADEAAAALYSIVVEGLCDDFTSAGVDCCNRVLAIILTRLRKTRQGQALNRLLNGLGFSSPSDLLSRQRRVAAASSIPIPVQKNVKKILVLSRVTIGADVAITGIIINRLAGAFPQAELAVIGPRHLAQIFNNPPGLRIIDLEFRRQGNLFDRLTTWTRLYEIMRDELQDNAPGETWLFDPDSRISQLGLLPFSPEKTTRLFNSRADQPSSGGQSLSVLTNEWLDRVLGRQGFQPPRASFSKRHLDRAHAFIKKTKTRGCRFFLAVNLGVGNNCNKRIPHPFARDLFLTLLRVPGTVILLDSGCHPEEKKRVRDILSACSRSVPTGFITEQELAEKELTIAHGMIGFQGSIGAIGALIEQADGFMGYDSCCQHLANAAGTPAVIVFAGAPNPRFLERWRPENKKGSTVVIPVGKSSDLSRQEIKNLVHHTTAELIKIQEKVN